MTMTAEEYAETMAYVRKVTDDRRASMAADAAKAGVTEQQIAKAVDTLTDAGAGTHDPYATRSASLVGGLGWTVREIAREHMPRCRRSSCQVCTALRLAFADLVAFDRIDAAEDGDAP